jgi:hypothetical protein
MMTMRRTSLIVAAGYALSFLVVCLGTCFAGATAEHACCAEKDGFRAAAVDCCFVTPGASQDGPQLTGMTTSAVSLPHQALMFGPHPAPKPDQAALAPSPPLILRI